MTTMRTRYHFSGVGGAGMSPLARLMRARGHAVQGSDRAFDAGKNREAADTLRAAGVELVPHDGSGITGVIDHFVFSTALEAETPEMRAARARGLAMLARPALLAELVDTGRPGVAVSGTSGKSTITGMLAWLARESGAVASVIGGAALVGEGGGGCLVPGPGDGAVGAEACESDGTLLRYHPALGLVHHVSRDHGELDLGPAPICTRGAPAPALSRRRAPLRDDRRHRNGDPDHRRLRAQRREDPRGADDGPGRGAASRRRVPAARLRSRALPARRVARADSVPAASVRPLLLRGDFLCRRQRHARPLEPRSRRRYRLRVRRGPRGRHTLGGRRSAARRHDLIDGRARSGVAAAGAARPGGAGLSGGVSAWPGSTPRHRRSARA